MEVSHSLTLNESALQQLPDDKKPHFIFEWLRFLDKVLVAAHKSDIKSCQQKLVAQLVNLLRENLGCPARRLLARNLATLFSVGDTFLLFDTVNKCNDIIKVKDDSPSYLPTRLAAICCLGSMYEKLGRMMGRSYEETVSTLVKSLKNAESQTRLEIMNTLEKICVGMGTAAPAAVREVSRAARAALVSERATAVRAAAAHTLRHLLPLMRLTPADLDAIAAACLRAAHSSDYSLRCAIAELLGALIAITQAGEVTNLNSKLKVGAQSVQQKKDPPKNVVSLDEALNLLMGAFLRGGTSFLKGEIIKSSSGVNREVRVCVTHAYVVFVQNMGGVWLERNMTTFLNHVLDLVANPKAASSHVDAVYSRKCINFILRNTLGKMLGEKAQASACREIIQIVIKQMNSIDFNPENAKDCNQETLFSQHLLVCALMEAGELALQLGTSVQNLVSDTSLNMLDAICTVLEHPCVAARLAAAWCIRCVCVALPSQITPFIDKCVDALDAARPTPHHISGYSAALAAILGAVRLSPLGVPHGRGKVAFNAAEQLLRSAGQSSRLTAARTNAGWLIVGAICTLGVPVVRGLLPRMLLLWRNSFPRSAKELESEKSRGDAFTWQVTLEGRAGALSALHSLLIHCPSLVNNDDTAKRLTQPIDGAIAVLTNVSTVVRSYGGALKAPAALLRLRVYQACYALGVGAAPPPAPLLRLLAAELAGSADPSGANVATGMYQACYALGVGAAPPPAPLLRLLAAELAGSADPSGANVATGMYQACYALGVGAAPPPAPLLRLLAAELAGSADPSGANVATGMYQACYALGVGAAPPPAPLLRLLAAELAGSADPSGANVATGMYQACYALGVGAAPPPAPLLRLLAAELAGSADPSGANVATGMYQACYALGVGAAPPPAPLLRLLAAELAGSADPSGANVATGMYQACYALGVGAAPPPAPLLRLLAAELAGSADPSGANVATGMYQACYALGVGAAPPPAPLLRLLAAELAGSADPSGANVATGMYQACYALGVGAAPPPAPLLRLLAAELAGSADPSGANVATGTLRSAMHPRDTILLGEEGWIYDTDHAEIEEQLISPLSASGSGALEHDPCCVYRGQAGAQPLGVAVIDASVLLFPLIFSRAANKHRQQMLEHFAECIKMSKGARQEAIQVNIYTALLLALRTLAELKSSLGQEAVKNIATEIVINGLSANSATVRAAAASCAGRLCGCITEAESQVLSEKVIALARTAVNRSVRAAAAAAVGAVQRARGAASSAAALPGLRALAQDTAAVELQVWSLHALSVLADASGPMFRGHVESTLNLALKLLFSAPPFQEDLHRSIGRLLSALITVVGPELQVVAVGRFVCACAALGEFGAGARSEALGCLQQLQMFAPDHINLHTLVPHLCRDLSSSELTVRRAALCCLRQLSQKEAAEVCKYALLAKDHVPAKPYCGVVITETGLPGALFTFLDSERDPTALSYARDTLTCCLLAAATHRSVRDWLALAKRVLTIRLEDSNNPETDFDAEGDDDQAEFHAESETSTHPAVQSRWPTRVFAMECIQKIMGACEATGDSAHFDLVKAKEKLQNNPEGDYLSIYLSDLVRMAFVGATGESDALRLCGLKTLQMIIQQYARAPEPDFPGHLLLEQYQAQVGAAVRPAFAGDTASHVTAAACDVCSAWIGCGVARDINDLRRVHQLLVSSLDKLNTKGNTTLIYNESMATLEKLSILKAWAEVYIVAMVSNGSAPGSYVKQLDTKPFNNRAELAKWRNQLLQNNNQIDNAEPQTPEDEEYGEFESKGESLLKLVEPELESLGENWIAALKDHALLSLPPEFASQLPHGGGAFYSAETAEASRQHYARAWPSLLYAASLRFNANIAHPQTDNAADKSEGALDNRSTKTENGNFEFFEPVDERFHLLFGICTEALCAQRDMTDENIISVLLSLVTLLDAPENRARLLKDRSLAIELCQIIHRTGLTQESIEALLLAADVLKLVIDGAREQLHASMQAKIKELAPNEATDGSTPQSVLEVVHTLGEGGPTGDLPPGKSVVFACLEACLCLLVRRLPALSPKKHGGAVGVIGVPKGLGVHGDTLLVKSLSAMSELPSLTSPQGALSILPTILYLATEILRESKGEGAAAEAGVVLLQRASECRVVRLHEHTKQQHAQLLQSALAKLVERVKSDEPEQRIEPVIGARGMAVVLNRATPSPPLHYPCINHFRQCLETNDNEMFSSCCSVLRWVWSRRAPPACVSWWARGLAAGVVARAAAARRPADMSHTRAAIAAFTALDELVDAAPDSARIKMLWLLVPIVISYLREGTELQRAAPHIRALHEFALQWLTRVGPKHPQEFKTMMQQSSELRNKLENALKANQASTRAGRAAQSRPLFDAKPAKPTIQLKTDFSDFR